MYDFYFGTREQIAADPKKWLLAIKRMLPRWPNGIPDSEYLALYDLLEEMGKDFSIRENKPVLVETGSGASTIVLLYFALRWGTELYTWDISNNKLAYLRGLLTDTLFNHFRDKNIFQHWKYVPYDSRSKYAGIPILAELDKSVAACFLDSEHTWNNLRAEVASLCPLMHNGGIIAIDDGNYRYKTSNTAYLNMLRTKLGLKPAEISDNECNPFWEEVEHYIKGQFKRIENMDGGSYRKTFSKDIFWSYYDADRSAMADLQMEKLDELAHRFDAWKVYHE